MTLTRSTALRSQLRERKCIVCKEKFQQVRAMQSVCDVECAAIKSRQDREKQERKETRERKAALRPRKWYLAKAKKALHAYIRARDEGNACISCDTILRKTGKPGGDFDAGHFRSVGSAKHLEFDERNIFGQCKHCNDYLKGNQLEYERRLRILKGDEYVDLLKSDNEPRHLTNDDFLRIEAESKAKLRALKEIK